MSFGRFKGAGDPGRKESILADPRYGWITMLDDRSFAVEFRGGEFAHAVAPDDRRFLMLRPTGVGGTEQLEVVDNWFEELKRKSKR